MTALPNTFMTPNIVVDRAMQYLSDAELRVLIFATRHILGWQDRLEDRKGTISLSTFEGGFTDKNGVEYGGCGLSRPIISKTLESLVSLGFLEKIGDPTPKGQEWKLGLNVDWPTLESRYAKKQEKNRAKTAKAAEASKAKRLASTLDVPAEITDQYVARTSAGTLDVPPASTLDVHIQINESNPSSNPKKEKKKKAQPLSRKKKSTRSKRKHRKSWQQYTVRSAADSSDSQSEEPTVNRKEEIEAAFDKLRNLKHTSRRKGARHERTTETA